MDPFAQFVAWIREYPDGIGFWAATLTTVSFAPQLVETWRTSGKGLSWAMLGLFGTGVGLWFVYGLSTGSQPVALANGLTGLQILALIAMKLWFVARPGRT